MKISLRRLDSIRPYDRELRTDLEEIEKLAALLQQFKFRRPIVVDADGVIVTGRRLYLAAQHLGLVKVPVHVASDLSPEDVRAYRVADNKASEWSSWNLPELQIELEDLRSEDYDLALAGFDPAALDQLLAPLDSAAVDETGTDPGQSAYREQYGVIVICRDADHQQKVYEELSAAGHECRIVCT